MTSSILVYPEARAALAAASRSGRLTEPEYAQVQSDFEGIYGDLVTIGIDEDLARRAGELSDRFALRGYDSVHLAAALELDDEVAMVSWDGDLQSAAAEAGLATLDR